jgi:RimJ/RimL family protein N-acetyltransferase
MNTNDPFRSGRLTGRTPDEDARVLYGALFGPDRGPARLAGDMQDWSRHAVAPWVLFHAGHPVGVGGFRIGFGEDGLELSFHFLPEVAGQGLASEFVQAALDHGMRVLREDRFFAFVPTDTPAPMRILEKAGFYLDREVRGERLMRLSLHRRPARHPAARGG